MDTHTHSFIIHKKNLLNTEKENKILQIIKNESGSTKANVFFKWLLQRLYNITIVYEESLLFFLETSQIIRNVVID